MCMCVGKSSALTSGAGILIITAAVVAANNGDHKDDQTSKNADQQPAAAVVVQDSPTSITQEAKNLLQDAKHDAQHGVQDAMQEAQDEFDPDAMMEAWLKAGTPGEHHKLLDDIVGNFTAEMTMSNGPGQPEEKMTGRTVNTWVLDGRYIQSEFYGDFNGMPFKGLGFTAYSNADQEIQSIWMDSLSTLMEMSTGTMDLDKKTMHMTAKTNDPAMGMKVDVDEVFTIISRDKHTFVRRTLMPDGTEVNKMTIVYTRTD